MDINDILAGLGLDLSNPEARRGAMEAIDAILDSRQPPESSRGYGSSRGTEENEQSDSMDIEVDPDLIQPSQKYKPDSLGDDVEIEDEENLLDQIKQNDSEIEPSGNTEGSEFNTDTDSTDDENTSDSENDYSGESENTESNTEDADNTGSETENSNQESDANDTQTVDTEENGSEEGTSVGSTDDDISIDDIESDDESSEADGGKSADADDTDDTDDIDDIDDLTYDDLSNDDSEDELENELEDESEDELEDELEDEDLLDDTLKGVYDDLDIKSKNDARRIKRERTLQAAKTALADAKTRKVSNKLIQDLEKAISALEELTEAVKSIKNISDDEFNRLINRVFDAIDAVGDKSLTFISDEDRELRAKEIKTDLADSRTQAALSAEDAAKIRAENQVIKARDEESNKYKARARGSFKGFNEFLNSLYRAIALQVKTDEVQDSTWSAISRRSSGAGVLQPGKRIQDLPDKKIPIIDFYFDCSGSWGPEDISVGKEAVKKLAEMEEDGKIKINIYYFAEKVHTDFESAEAEGSTSGWNDIVKNIISTRATNVVIMTDSDMENWWVPQSQPPLRYTVPGYVWYLWRDGINAPRLPRDLKGRGGTQQFSFSRGSV